MKAIQATDFSLDLTLSSSFACYLFSEKRTKETTTWVGEVDPIKGAQITQKAGTIQIRPGKISNPGVDYLGHEVIGLWHRPASEDLDSSSVLRKLAEEVLPGIRVPKLTLNKWHVLLSALLSVHAKVEYSRAWFRSLMSHDLRELRTTTALQLREHTKNRTGISAGFRMRYLTELVNELSSIYPEAKDPLEELCQEPTPRLRLRLLRIRNLGPKVCDCFLLNGLGDLTAPPIDVHVKRITEYLGILPAGLGMPQPSFCREFICSREQSQEFGIPVCPRSEATVEYLEKRFNPSGTCARAAMTHKFRQAGWVQAMLFLFGQRHCTMTTRREVGCPGCPMNSDCLRDTISSPPAQRHRVHFRMVRPRPSAVSTPQFAELPLFELYPEVKEVVLSDTKRLAQEVPIHLSRSRSDKAACLLLACRLKKLPILIDEIASAYSAKPWHVLSSYNQIREEAGMFTGLADPKLYIERLQRALRLSHPLVSMANSLADRNRSRCMNPVSLAAACVFLAACKIGEPVRQREISSQLLVSEVTIRNVARKTSEATH